jgi:hypothetical protein
MKLADNWKSIWKWISFQCFCILGAIHGIPLLMTAMGSVMGVDAALLDKFGKDHIYFISMATFLLSGFGIFGLLIQQDSLPNWIPWKIKDGGQPPEENK